MSYGCGSHPLDAGASSLRALRRWGGECHSGWRVLWRGQSMSMRPAAVRTTCRRGRDESPRGVGLRAVDTPWCMIVFVTGWKSCRATGVTKIIVVAFFRWLKERLCRGADKTTDNVVWRRYHPLDAGFLRRGRWYGAENSAVALCTERAEYIKVARGYLRV